jgi:hypothetical protein
MTPLAAIIRTLAIASSAMTLTLWLGAPVAVAQHRTRTVFGQVRNADGRPLAQAQVMVPGQQTGVLTDAVGRYVLTSLPADKVVVKARRIGFPDKVDSVYVKLGAQVELDFVLWPLPNPLDDPVIVVPRDTGADRTRRR